MTTKYYKTKIEHVLNINTCNYFNHASVTPTSNFLYVKLKSVVHK
jgi:hypothetical protein